MTFEEVAEKFRGCAGFAGWPRQKAESVIDIVRSLGAAPDVGRLAAILAT